MLGLKAFLAWRARKATQERLERAVRLARAAQQGLVAPPVQRAILGALARLDPQELRAIQAQLDPPV